MKLIHYFFLLIFLLIAQIIWAQENPYTDKIDQINRKAFLLRYTKPDSAILLAKEAWLESEKYKYAKGKALAFARIALAKKGMNELDSAIYYFEESLNIRQASNLPKNGIAAMYTQIGNIYKNKDLFARSIVYLKKALSIREELGKGKNISDANSDLAIAYKDLALRKKSVNDSLAAKADNTLAIFHFNKSLEILKEENLQKQFASKAKMLASVFAEEKNYPRSLEYLNEAEVIYDSLLNESEVGKERPYLDALADIYTRKGLVYNESGEFEKGKPFHEKAIEINRQIADTLSLFISLINMGDNALKLKVFPKALENFEEAKKLSSTTEFDKRLMLILYENLATSHEALGDAEKSNNYLKKRYQLNTEISLESNLAQIEDATENIKLESENYQIKIEKDYQEKLTFWTIIGGVLVSALLSIILYFSYQRQKYQKIIIDNQEASHTQHLLSQLEEAEQQILADQSAKQQMMLTTIGKELHDSIGSMLAAAKREMENLKMNLTDISSKAEGQFEHSYVMVDKAIRDLRKISKSPDKLSLDEQLVPSLRELCKNINRIENSPHIELNTYRLEGVKLPAKHELHIFRVIQEAITNIIKHAKASEINLQLDWANRVLSITIEDNGVGFDPAQIKYGVGLDSMRTRTEDLKGTFTLDTAPAKGSTIFMEVPIPG
ncbi:MAG: ATP-binding protein [Bacteroidota bacterium]